MIAARLLEPPAFLLWLSTGARRLSFRRLRSGCAALLLFLSLGPAATALPAIATDQGATLPPPLVGTGLHPGIMSASAAERLLGTPLLDSGALHQQADDLGVWGTTLEGPFGHTVVVFRVLATTRHTWFTVLELRSERPLTDSPWDLIVAQPTVLNGQPAKLYEQPGSTTVAWQETPTLHISLSEDSQQPRSTNGSSAQLDVQMLSEGQLLAVAASLHPRGFQVGPFHLDRPW